MKSKRVDIHVGECYASKDGSIIVTILGSCVAACLFDPVNRIGGMNHILMPGRADIKHFDEPTRYSINAMELLINRMMDLGGDRDKIVAKVFGGAHLIPTISKENMMGEKNVSFTLEFLKREGIRVISRDVGGTDARKIFFHTNTGDVFLRRIPSTYQNWMIKKESLELKRIQKIAHLPGEVTFFHE